MIPPRETMHIIMLYLYKNFFCVWYISQNSAINGSSYLPKGFEDAPSYGLLAFKQYSTEMYRHTAFYEIHN